MEKTDALPRAAVERLMAVIETLRTWGPMPLLQLQLTLGRAMSQRRLSWYLSMLRQAGLVEIRGGSVRWTGGHRPADEIVMVNKEPVPREPAGGNA